MAYFKTLVVAGITTTVQKFTTGTSQTYTTPSGVQYIRVRIIGGGGGGAGGGTGTETAGGNGGDSTFSSGGITLTSGGGVGGAVAAGNGGAGGTASISGGPSGTSLPGGSGTAGYFSSPLVAIGGGGGDSYFSGGGSNAYAGNNGTAGSTNTGGGGGGGGCNAAVSSRGGAGGGGGGFVDAIIGSPAATFTYTVGASGTAGAAGTSGGGGAAGSAGYIEVTEYYTAIGVGTSTAASANTVLAGPSSGAAANPTLRAMVPADLPTLVQATAYISPATLAVTINTNINFDTVTTDSHSAVTTGGGTWVFTVPSGCGGNYFISASLDLSTTACTAYVAKNGVGVGYLVTLSPAGVLFSGSSLVPAVVAGDTLAISVDTGTTLNGGAGTGGVLSHISIFRIGS